MKDGTQRRTLARMLAATAVTVSLGFGAGAAAAQQGQGGGGGGGGQRQLTTPYDAADTTGFTRIFTPGSLAGWDGDPKFWSVRGDTIIAESTPANPVTENTFLIYRGDQNLGDFELKAEYRFPSLQGNGGVQVRSSVRPGAPHQWRVTGIQVDLDATNRYSGQLYGEAAGGFLAPRGELTRIVAGQALPKTVGSLGSATELRGVMNMNGWNQLHIIARGNQITVLLNGRVASMLIDENPAGTDPAQARLRSGLIALQMHTGQPFQVMYRNIWLRKL